MHPIWITSLILSFIYVWTLIRSVFLPLHYSLQWNELSSNSRTGRGSSLFFYFLRKRPENFLFIINNIILQTCFAINWDMDSIISEKRRLHETLLSFPPFYTYSIDYEVCKSTKSQEKSRLATGENLFIPIADSIYWITKAQHHQLFGCGNMEPSSSGRQIYSSSQYKFHLSKSASQNKILWLCWKIWKD